jgi:hypothetical protein
MERLYLSIFKYLNRVNRILIKESCDFSFQVRRQNFQQLINAILFRQGNKVLRLGEKELYTLCK